MDDEIPEHGDSHASSSYEASLEPIFQRREDLCKHNVYTHFLKDRNCEVCLRTMKTRAPCRRRNGEAVPRAANFGDLITADHKVLSDNCESRNNHLYAVVVQDLAAQWIQAYLCKNKNFSGNPEKLAQVPGTRTGFLKSFTLTIPWNSGRPVKISPGIIARRHHTDQKHIRLLREQCAERKKVHLPYCCNQVWMKIGGQIPWNAIPICETFKISRLIEKPHMRDVLGNHLKARLFRLIHWLSITIFLRRTSQESISLERKSYLDCSSDTLCTREEFGRVTCWLQTLKSWKRWTHQKSTRKDSMQRK